MQWIVGCYCPYDCPQKLDRMFGRVKKVKMREGSCQIALLLLVKRGCD